MNAKPKWTAFLCVLAYSAVAVLALNSYQGRLSAVAGPRSSAAERLVVSAKPVAGKQQPRREAEIVSQAENRAERREASPPAMPSPAQTIAPALAAHSAIAQDDRELLGCLAAELARTAMKEGSIVLPRQIVKREPRHDKTSAKLVGFRLPRSTPRIEPPQPASLLVTYQSRLLVAAADVQARMSTYLRWVRFRAAVRELISDFEKTYLQPVLERVQQRQSAVEVLYDLNYRTYDISRYACPVA